MFLPSISDMDFMKRTGLEPVVGIYLIDLQSTPLPIRGISPILYNIYYIITFNLLLFLDYSPIKIIKKRKTYFYYKNV